ncbi:MFS transporter [Streptomyces sp. CNQ085]|uniref:MFS transporter n=1 Tax=Streptomyces sp. CNQ085 TaxID=2886944 RepID=UPI001F509379|nr:MFS transporter [Streptomyces sp. CNQ085]MCI0385721.1 MFS transporter [Streptomyces sp. CNQ085]
MTVNEQVSTVGTPQTSGLVTRRPLVLALLVVCQLMLVIDTTVLNVALPHIQHDLGFTSTGLSWVVNAYTLVFGGLLLLGSRVGDLCGRRQVFVAGITIFTLSSLAAGLADSATVLIAARVAQAVGAAAAGPNALALITTTFTKPEDRVWSLGWFSAVASGGFPIGLMLGGVLTDLMSWRATMFINVPIGIAALVLAPRLVPVPERHRAQLDLPGASAATGGVAALVFGLIRAAEHGWNDGPTIAVLVVGVVLVAAFLTIESRTGQPLMPLRLFTDRNRGAAYSIMLLMPMVTISTFFFLTQFLQNVLGWNAFATGFAFLAMALGLVITSRSTTWLLPRFGPKRLVITGTVLIVLGMAVLTRLSTTTGYFPGLLVPLVLLGVGTGLTFSSANVVIMSTVEARDAGAAGGTLQTMQELGSSLGLAVLITVFGFATGHAHSPSHALLVTGMTRAFAAAAIFAACAFGVAFSFRSTPHSDA